MSVFGVDLGCLNSVVAVTRQGGVDVVCNEVSKRDTATYVSYLNEERLIGESGFDKAVRNAKNTVACVKRLIGLKRSDARAASELRFVNCATTDDAQGNIMLEVDYNGEMTPLYPEQVLAAFLGKLKKYVAIETKTEGKDCVITVPCWYTIEQRKLVNQAAEMAGLNPLSLINETTASSVDYGIFRVASLPDKEDDAHTVAILDLGNAGTTVTISKFWKGNMRVLAHAFDTELGTREVDWLLYQHMANEVQKKYKIDVTENTRARVRLLQACDKVKCMLSANANAPLNIENLMDVDINLMYDRESIEKVMMPLCEKLKALAERALSRAGVAAGSLTALEVIGGGSRIPLFKTTASEAFGVQASFTLNASESIARGAAITAATFSPLFQVREYIVNEAPLCPLMLGYHSDRSETSSSVSFLPESINKISTLLRDGDRYPKTIDLTFNRSEAFDLYAFYDDNHADSQYVPKNERAIVGRWTVGGPNGKTTNGSVKLRVKFHASGLLSIEGASTQEVYEREVEEVVKEESKAEGEQPPPVPPADGAEAPPAEEKKPEPAKPKTVRVKKEAQRRLELTVTPALNLGHPAEVFLQCQKTEAAQDARDLTIQRTREVRNELEAYVYDNRSSIKDGNLKAFVTDADRTTFVSQATEIEDWLYGDGDNASLNEYQTRLDQLRVIGAACIRRQRLSEELPFAQSAFEKKVLALKEQAETQRGKKEHITNDDINGAIAKCDEAVAWSAAQLQEYQAKPAYEDPSLAPGAFDAKLKEVDGAVKAVLNKKAPKKEEPKKEESKKEAEKKEGSGTDAQSPTGPEPPADLD